MDNLFGKIKKTFSFKDKFENPISWPEVTVEQPKMEDVAVEIPKVEEKPFTGIPAPVIPPYDPWFDSVVLSEKSIQYMIEEVRENQKERENVFSVEPDNMHQVMYDVATRSNNTTLDLNPPSSPGGSENFHEGPGGWTSGTGLNQFR